MSNVPQNPVPQPESPDGPGQLPPRGAGIGGPGQPGWADETGAGMHAGVAPANLDAVDPNGRPVDPGFAAYNPMGGPAPEPPKKKGKALGIVMIVLGGLVLLAFVAGLANGSSPVSQDAAERLGGWIGRLLMAALGVLLLVFGIRRVRH